MTPMLPARTLVVIFMVLLQVGGSSVAHLSLGDELAVLGGPEPRLDSSLGLHLACPFDGSSQCVAYLNV